MNSLSYKIVKIILKIAFVFELIFSGQIISMFAMYGYKLGYKGIIYNMYPIVIGLLWTLALFFFLRMLKRIEKKEIFIKNIIEPKIISYIFLVMAMSEFIFFWLTKGKIIIGSMDNNGISLAGFIYLFIYLVFLILPTLFSEIKNLDEENKSII
ncbi:DUF2975 domain-containing protein [Peptostreptococcus faecalis]|uniref:DUF2975 domain-containing protein n=1 Tax=Peptostreptococcus faecalis TaxID=2045015 RepID=UPI000C7BDD5E|nr:DUF2975 domain-containing protein [Peptostreptococcus faecalis]